MCWLALMQHPLTQYPTHNEVTSGSMYQLNVVERKCKGAEHGYNQVKFLNPSLVVHQSSKTAKILEAFGLLIKRC